MLPCFTDFCSPAVYLLEKAKLIILLMGAAIRDINFTLKPKSNSVWKLSKNYEG